MSPVPLHVHSHFTLLGATPAVADLARRAAADSFTHLALTDANALYGAVRFARACEAAGVQPIVGMTLTLTPPADFPRADALSPGVVTLLAMNRAGYRSLSRLSSRLQGYPDREQRLQQGLSLDDLAECRDGVIGIFGGRRSWLERWLRLGDERRAALSIFRQPAPKSRSAGCVWGMNVARPGGWPGWRAFSMRTAIWLWNGIVPKMTRCWML